MKNYLWLIPAGITFIVAVWFMVYWAGSTGSLPKPERKKNLLLGCSVHPMKRNDVLPVIIITVVYAVTAFIGLGSGRDPESMLLMRNSEQEAIVELDDAELVDEIWFYTGIKTGKYLVDTSLDGEGWSEPVTFEQTNAEQLHWVKLDVTARIAKYVRVRAETPPLYLGEIVCFNVNGERVGLVAGSGGKRLSDEQDTFPERVNYLTNAYFDEIYHVRTAYEHILEIQPYELSHPPLGKLIIAAGIRIFGLNPFGWRFMGTLFGVLMLPLLYILIKNMFGKTVVAACGTMVFAFDFMHFVQTRIATIDTYGVFFILLMFLFMYRYFALPLDTPFKKTLAPLIACGISFGLGAASKWIVFYGGAGLAVVWLIRQIAVARYLHKERKPFGRYLAQTVGASVVFFVVVPAIIYVTAYVPYAHAAGEKAFSAEHFRIVLENQKFMFSYHSKLVATHPYSSPWWSWLVDGRPILYYLEYMEDGRRSAFGAFGNPLVWWTGLLAIIAAAASLIRRKRGEALFIIIAYLAQLLPWVFVTRICFIYHYFPSALFLAVAISMMMNDIVEARHIRGKWGCTVFVACCVILFLLFYPALTGVPITPAYGDGWLSWFAGAYPF
ncbi:MAG: phospholipid carrier-dependent glycosyltransferase [Oscillospiraceae bacterium]|nr:phospholipid carrier-dependent glycosyltransferase [Oscillospiraceae bacterium]